jgi:hypothetical protein
MMDCPAVFGELLIVFNRSVLSFGVEIKTHLEYNLSTLQYYIS